MKIFGENSTTFIHGGKAHTVDSSHPQFHNINQALRSSKMADAVEMMDTGKALRESIPDDAEVVFDHGIITFMGRRITGSAVDRILKMHELGISIEPMILFMGRLLRNPNKKIHDRLFDFLDAGNMPITEDGHFLAYKRITQEYKDFWTGRLNYAVGQKIEVPWSEVDCSDSSCSKGIHWCSYEHLPHYCTTGHVVVVKVDPAGVGYVGSLYNKKSLCKGRGRGHEIVEEISEQWARDTGLPAYFADTTKPIAGAETDESNAVDDEIVTSEGIKWKDVNVNGVVFAASGVARLFNEWDASTGAMGLTRDADKLFSVKSDTSIHYRLSDRILQKARKAGVISYDKDKRAWVRS